MSWLEESIDLKEPLVLGGDDQASLEWLEERRKGLGASDLPVVMGNSPYMTPYELWLEKTGRTPLSKNSNFAIDRGVRWEDRVRERFNAKVGMKFHAKNFQSEENEIFRASLDGYDVTSKEGLEIKVAGKEVVDMAKKGIVHTKYIDQVQWQIFVAGLTRNNFYAVEVDLIEGHEQVTNEGYVPVMRDDEHIERLKAEALKFWEYVTEGIAPPLSDRDELELKDEKARNAFSSYRSAKAKRDEAKALFDAHDKVCKELEKALKKFATHPKIACEGILMSKITKKGTIDYSKVPEGVQIDLEQYRKKPTEYFKFTIKKGTSK